MARDDHFGDMLAARFAAGLHVCVGLDTDLARVDAGFLAGVPAEERVIAYNKVIVDATSDLVAAYKPNIAFYEALGDAGLRALATTIAYIAESAPDVPVILDAKRADIASTNEQYADAAFDYLRAHAITVHPYFGGEALQPFLRRADKGVFVLVHTSNPGAAELQDTPVDGIPLYRHVARRVATAWNGNGNCGLVVGGTYPGEMVAVRDDVGPELPILVPGVGAQGGDLDAVVRAHAAIGSRAMLVGASRSVLFATGGAAPGDAARAEVQRIAEDIVAAYGAVPS